MSGLQQSDINSLAKINAIISDADLMSADEILQAIQVLKGNAPSQADTLEKLYNIIQGLGFLKAEDIDTLSEINQLISDADLTKSEDLTGAIAAVKGAVPAAGDTLEKIYLLLEPLLVAWVQGGNTVTSMRPIGTKNSTALPFITANIERARFDTGGNFLLGYAGSAVGRLHIRASNLLEATLSICVDDAASNLLFGVGNSGKMYVNKNKTSLLINGGWPGMTGLRNIIMTSGPVGAQLVDAGNDNIVIGYNAASSSGANPIRGLARNVVIGSEAATSDNNGTSYSDSVYIGYRAGLLVGVGAGSRNTMVGALAGAVAAQAGSDNICLGYDSQNARSNVFNTLLGVGTRSYNSFGDLVSNGGPLTHVTAIGAGAIVRTSNTLVLGRRLSDQVVIGAESCNFQLPGLTANQGFSGYRLQIINPSALALGISGNSLFRDGNLTINLGEDGKPTVKNSFQINTYLIGQPGFDFLISASNADASLEIKDSLANGVKPEIIRITGQSHLGTFFKLVETNNTIGNFIEATRFDIALNAQALKFAVDKEGVLSLGLQTGPSPIPIPNAVRIYFDGVDLVYVTPDGHSRLIDYQSV